MLVCNVVLRPQRHRVTADIVEVAGALDAPALAIIFATITDAPGSASDRFDAFVGSRLPEAANATDTADALSVHPALVVEEISAAVAVQNATLGGVVGGVARSGMVGTAMINSGGTVRQANADGTMLNL